MFGESRSCFFVEQPGCRCHIVLSSARPSNDKIQRAVSNHSGVIDHSSPSETERETCQESLHDCDIKNSNDQGSLCEQAYRTEYAAVSDRRQGKNRSRCEAT